jgi:hypothetical protein
VEFTPACRQLVSQVAASVVGWRIQSPRSGTLSGTLNEKEGDLVKGPPLLYLLPPYRFGGPSVHRDLGIRTRDPLNPIRLRGLTNHEQMSDCRGKPIVGAGLPEHRNRGLPGETAPQTAPVLEWSCDCFYLRASNASAPFWPKRTDRFIVHPIKHADGVLPANALPCGESSVAFRSKTTDLLLLEFLGEPLRPELTHDTTRRMRPYVTMH